MDQQKPESKAYHTIHYPIAGDGFQDIHYPLYQVVDFHEHCLVTDIQVYRRLSDLDYRDVHE